MPHLSITTPIGDLTLFQSEGALVALEWGRAGGASSTVLLEKARAQLEAYFTGASRSFDLPLCPEGTLFQHTVWQHLQRIPFGHVRTYGEIASTLKTSARAVGTACGRNPLPIIIPCHRVVGTGRGLVGYSGGEGIETKCALLFLENASGFSKLATSIRR